MSKSSALVGSLPIIRNPRHQIFVNKYQETGFRDPIAAYQAAYGCKRESAKVSADRLLLLVPIQQEIARRIESTSVVTKDSLASDLLKYKSWAETAGDYDSASEIAIKCAKLLGLIVDKQEVMHLDDAQRDAIRRTVSEAVRSN